MTTLLNSFGASLGILAAGLIFAYANWTGPRDLAWRAALGVLGAVVFGGVLPFLLIELVPSLAAYDSRNVGRGAGLLLLLVVNIIGTLVAFLPWLIAGNWLFVLRRDLPRA